MAKLLPLLCPYCGQAKIFVETDSSHAPTGIECENCGAEWDTMNRPEKSGEGV